jgi:heptosyltransferase-2
MSVTIEGNFGLPALTKLLLEPIFFVQGLRHGDGDFRPEKVRSLAVVNLNPGIGDLVVTTPLLRELRRNFPNAWITLVIVDRFANLLEFCPYVSEIITIPQFHRLTLAWTVRCAMRLAKLCWKRRFDFSIALPSNACPLAAYLVGASVRFGYMSEPCYDQLLTRSFKAPDEGNFVEHNLQLLKLLKLSVESDRLELWLTNEDEEFARQFFERTNLARKFIVGLGPGSSNIYKKWPFERFVEICQWLISEHDASIVVVGEKADSEMGEKLASLFGSAVSSLAGKTTPRQAAAVLKRCHLYVGNDTGPKHLAAAVQKPIVEISSVPENNKSLVWMSPDRWRAWGVPGCVVMPSSSDSVADSDVPRIDAVSVSMVQDAISSLLSEKICGELATNL